MNAPTETSPALSTAKTIRHAFFGRRGGVSEGEFASLNTSRRVGDDPANVAENLHRATMALKAGARPLVTVRQVHGTTVYVHEGQQRPAEHPEADAVVTRERGVVLGIRTADCVPVLFADAEAGIIAAAHAGWRGAVDGVVSRTVEAMIRLGADPSRIAAAIGPAISAENYEVGEDFARTIAENYAEALPFVIREGHSSPHFDVPGLVLSQLSALGIASDRVGGCTYAHPELYFSHRYSTHHGGRAGRQIALISQD